MNEFEHQHPSEVMQMVEKARGLKSVLEIGSATGHTLAMLALVGEKGAKVCSIDAGLAREKLANTITKLRAAGYDAHVFDGDSHSAEALAFAYKHGPFDFVFIDGDHSYEGAKADWESYGPLGKVVAFHDIAHPHHDVSKLWAEIKEAYKTEEIVLTTMGIGMVYR